MTRQEALEYLNLPKQSSDQLIQKRYQELQKDYQKAISNAPSQHFRDLYSENLDKIEEAYLLMKSTMMVAAPDALVEAPKVTRGDNPSLAEEPSVEQNLWEVKTLVNTFITHNDLTGKALSNEAREQVQKYIDQISSWQDKLRDENTPEPLVTDPAVELAAVAPLVTKESPSTPLEELGAENPETNGQESNTMDENFGPKPLEPEVENEVPQEVPEEVPESLPAVEESAIPVAEPLEESPEKVTPASKVSLDQMKSTRDGIVDRIFKDESTLERNKSFNKLVTAAILTVFFLGIGGMYYMIYPILYSETSEATTPLELDQTEPAVGEIAIAQIVGDEFFRTENYLEALVQYTTAFADDPDNAYLKNRIDSCKILLSESLAANTIGRPEPPVGENTNRPAAASPNRQTQINTANRFRGEESVEPKSFVWSDWSEDQDLNEQVINSARSAQLNQPDTPATHSATLSQPKTSGDGAEEAAPEETIKNFVDTKPEPQGGWDDFKKYTSRHIKFPVQAYKAKVSGIVLVQFVVRIDGTISDTKVVQGIGYGCDEEAIRVLEGYKGWTPGVLDGQIVNTRAVIPIHFKLAN